MRSAVSTLPPVPLCSSTWLRSTLRQLGPASGHRSKDKLPTRSYCLREFTQWGGLKQHIAKRHCPALEAIDALPKPAPVTDATAEQEDPVVTLNQVPELGCLAAVAAKTEQCAEVPPRRVAHYSERTKVRRMLAHKGTNAAFALPERQLLTQQCGICSHWVASHKAVKTHSQKATLRNVPDMLRLLPSFLESPVVEVAPVPSAGTQLGRRGFTNASARLYGRCSCFTCSSKVTHPTHMETETKEDPASQAAGLFGPLAAKHANLFLAGSRQGSRPPHAAAAHPAERAPKAQQRGHKKGKSSQLQTQDDLLRSLAKLALRQEGSYRHSDRTQDLSCFYVQETSLHSRCYWRRPTSGRPKPKHTGWTSH